jgi:prolyl-tRNA synthetase
LFQRAVAHRTEKTTPVDSWEEFQEVLEKKGGFLLAHWDGTAETEEKIKEATKATIRCIPLDAPEEDGKCVFSGEPSKKRVIFAKAY